MRKLLFLSILCTLSSVCFSLDIYVAPSYSDDVSSNNQKTLKGAYDRLLHLFPGKTIHEPVNIFILNDCFLAISPQTLASLSWDISGTSDFPLVITSGAKPYPQVYRPSYDHSKQSYILELRNVNFVTISGLRFPEATVGIFINSSDYCNITNCQFIGNRIRADEGSGVIALTREPTSLDMPKYNKIQYNYLLADGAATVTGNHGSSPGYSLHQGIYIAQAEHNLVEYNTIINPSGYGIHYWHGYSQNNTVQHNIIDVCSDGRKKGGLVIGYGDCSNEGCTESTVNGNTNSHNYITFSEKVKGTSKVYLYPNGSKDFAVMKSVASYNPAYTPNYFSHASNTGKYCIDPYWLLYNPNQVTQRMVAGDFDGDGQFDDMAALYDDGNQQSRLHVWLNKKIKVQGAFEQEKSFQHEGAWWSAKGFDAAKITGRLVSGDFNGDGKTDIAALHDDGNGTSRIHVWKSTGKSFTSSGETEIWWASGSGAYDAGKVTARFVSGDFNNDSKTDIAAMYDYGNSQSKIHIWFSNGRSFNDPSVAWTSNPNAYDAAKVTGRFVSGDFNNDKKDDLAAVYDNGTSGAAIHVWSSNGSSFLPKGEPYTYWKSGTDNIFDANGMTHKLVAGDFDKDGKDDLAAMYDDGNHTARLYWWKSAGNSFSAPAAGWSSEQNGYDASKISGRMLCGDFNNDGISDIAGMFDYSQDTNFYRARTHVWETGGNAFRFQNGSLGYPWMKNGNDIGMNCAPEKMEVPKTLAHDPAIINLYPDVAGNTLTVISPAAMEQTTLILTDRADQVLLRQEFLQGQAIDISDLPAGIYLITLSNEMENLLFKFMKK